MDPLSVMASVAGLLTAAGKVVSMLSVVKKSIVEVLRLLDQMLSQVKELEICLSAVQSFLLELNSAPRGRISMIRIDHLVATLTEAVRTFSELDTLVKSIAGDDGMSVKTRLMYIWEEGTTASIMLRLERDKSSLSLMLNIIQCESDLEAAQSRESLQNLVEELLRSNNDVSRRLQRIEDKFESQSIMTTCFRNGTLSEHGEDKSEVEGHIRSEEGTLMKLGIGRSSMIVDSLDEFASQTNFQVDLGASRVYKRTELYESDVSFTSSEVRTHAWSIFSGLTLSEISMISAVALPLYVDELSYKEYYMPSQSAEADVQMTAQATKETHTRDVLPDTASETTLDPIIQLQSPKKSKKPRSRLFSPLSLSRNSNSFALASTPMIRDSLGPYVSVVTERLAAESSNKAVSSSSKPMPIEEKLPLYRLAVLGDNDVERSAFTKQLTLQHSIYSYEPTSEEPSYLQRVVIGQHACVLGVLDTAGQEGTTALRGKWIREGHGFVLVYSITSRLSFVQIPRFHDQIQRVKKRANLINYPGSNLTTVSPPFCPIKLFGNNCHRSNEREVSTEEGQALAKKLGCKFVEVSTESHINENAFYDVVRDIRQHRLQAAMKEKELTRWGASL